MTKVEYAVQWAIDIANDSTHGYDQGNRWGPDYDCSSLIITAYELAGVPVKTNGASRTSDMKSAFLRTGFYEIPSWNKLTGDGLQRGDVVLKVGSHVEMYIGDGKLVKAAINERGGAIGGTTGDQTGKEIRVGGYYNFPWDCALRYGNAAETTNATIHYDTTTAAGAMLSNTTIDINTALDYTQISPYIITLTRNSRDVDYGVLSELGVIGVMIECGGLYDVTHTVNKNYRNPKLDKQVQAAIDGNMRYALYADVRSKNVAEADKELQELSVCVQKYTPPLGVWLRLNFNNSKAINNRIVDVYKERLERLGLKGKIGFYVTDVQLKKIDWKPRCHDWLLWIDDHVDDISEIQTILTPEFFMHDPDKRMHGKVNDLSDINISNSTSAEFLNGRG